MSRFLFVVPPSAGATNPTLAVGRELAGRGHLVAWAGHPEIVGPLLPDDAGLIPVSADLTSATMARLVDRAQGLRGAAGFRFLWADFAIPLAASMVPGVDAAVEDFLPDVLVVDQFTVAGGLVARQRGLRWATSVTSSAELTLGPKVRDWVRRCLFDFQRDFGVPEAEAHRGDLRFSDQLVLIFATEALVGPVGNFPDHFVFVGPSMDAHARRPVEFPWDWLDPARRHVLVSLGTLNGEAGQRFFPAVVEAVAPLADRLQVVLVAPSHAVHPLPDHVLVRPFVPQLELLPHIDAVVCHAGHNTVCESLAHGIPLVVAPIRDDHPIVATQVTAAGAGIRVKFGRVSPLQLRDAITTLLDDPAYGAAARRVQASLAAAGGAAAGADHLEKLASLQTARTA